MRDRCASCMYFDYEDTDLPTCLLWRKLVDFEWTCASFREA